MGYKNILRGVVRVIFDFTLLSPHPTVFNMSSTSRINLKRMPDVPNFPTYCTNRFMISVPKKPHTAKLFCWNFKIQELNNFHKFDKYAISLPEVLFGGSLRVLWDRHYKV